MITVGRQNSESAPRCGDGMSCCGSMWHRDRAIHPKPSYSQAAMILCGRHVSVKPAMNWPPKQRCHQTYSQRWKRSASHLCYGRSVWTRFGGRPWISATFVRVSCGSRSVIGNAARLVRRLFLGHMTSPLLRATLGHASNQDSGLVPQMRLNARNHAPDVTRTTWA